MAIEHIADGLKRCQQTSTVGGVATGAIMHRLDVESWARRKQYELYRQFDQPHFNMCANVDLTAFRSAVKARGITFTVGVLYVLARAANDIPAFRHRMRGNDVVEHDTVHPATTILSDDGSFGFCTLTYTDDFPTFASGAAHEMALARMQPSLTDGIDRDDVLYTTSIPWVSFTSFAHPTHLHPADSVPRLAWGKRFEDGHRVKMPLSVQGHHAMMDGLHMGQYYERVQTYLSQPEATLGTGDPHGTSTRG
jgi:chloramphenicol O-acetyltransferase type A